MPRLLGGGGPITGHIMEGPTTAGAVAIGMAPTTGTAPASGSLAITTLLVTTARIITARRLITAPHITARTITRRVTTTTAAITGRAGTRQGRIIGLSPIFGLRFFVARGESVGQVHSCLV